MIEQGREDYGPVQALVLGKRLFRVAAPYMWARAFAVDGLLIDAGLPEAGSQVLAFAREQRVERAALTHHHEDHSGGTLALQAAQVPVAAAAKTRRLLARGFSVPFYQRRVWGVPRRAEVEALEPVIETERCRFEVLEAPGHCRDQVVLYERAQGWLFSGDAFLAERVKLFRSDEDFGATLRSLERLVELDFEALFCAHRPRPSGGRAALRAKLEHLRQVEGRVRELAEEGLGQREITRRVLGRESALLQLLTRGDLSKRNLIRAILEGPRYRRDVSAALAAPPDGSGGAPSQGLTRQA